MSILVVKIILEFWFAVDIYVIGIVLGNIYLLLKQLVY